MKMEINKKSVIDFYLDYVNNFLTVKHMAEYYDMPEAVCLYLVELGKKYHSKIK